MGLIPALHTSEPLVSAVMTGIPVSIADHKQEVFTVLNVEFRSNAFIEPSEAMKAWHR